MKGSLTEEHLDVLRPYLQDKRVLDLGCGDGALANRLVREGGASEVVAVDKDPVDDEGWSEYVRFVESTFVELDLDVYSFDVGFVSWPNIYKARGLERLLEGLPLVVYLGYNFDSTACGSDRLWRHLMLRPILEEMPSRQNNVHVYGMPSFLCGREPVPEEKAALDRTRIYRWSDFYDA